MVTPSTLDTRTPAEKRRDTIARKKAIAAAAAQTPINQETAARFRAAAGERAAQAARESSPRVVTRGPDVKPIPSSPPESSGIAWIASQASIDNNTLPIIVQEGEFLDFGLVREDLFENLQEDIRKISEVTAECDLSDIIAQMCKLTRRIDGIQNELKRLVSDDRIVSPANDALNIQGRVMDLAHDRLTEHVKNVIQECSVSQRLVT